VVWRAAQRPKRSPEKNQEKALATEGHGRKNKAFATEGHGISRNEEYKEEKIKH